MQEMEELKRVFLEGNPYFLFLTFVVSLLHSVFDMLAFKNDIGFWRANKSMEGLSAKTVIINAFCQLVIFLYLLDNETSRVVLISSGPLQQVFIMKHLSHDSMLMAGVLPWVHKGSMTKTILLNNNSEIHVMTNMLIMRPICATPWHAMVNVSLDVSVS